VNFSVVSPASRDLDLTAHGYRIDLPEILYATLDGTGRTLTVYRDVERTATELVRHSRADADAYRALLDGLGRHAQAILDTVFFTPSPDLAAGTELTPAAVR